MTCVKTLTAVSTLFALSAAFGAAAQTTSNQPAPSAAPKGLEEITVTAQRRETNLQVTPVAVTAYTPEALERGVISDALNLYRAVPNFVAKNNVVQGNAATYFIRGIGNTEIIPTFDVPVGTYIDEVYVARQNNNNANLSDTERVEILRGPQGTLFGRNTTGGAVVITTQKPGEAYEVKGDVGYGSYNRIFGKLSVNVPLGDKIATRISGYGIHDNGWQTSVTTGEKYSFDHEWGIRDAIRLRPSDNVEWNITGDYSRQNHLQLGSAVNDALSYSRLTGPAAYVTGGLDKIRTYQRNCQNGANALAWTKNNCNADVLVSYDFTSNLKIEFPAFTMSMISGYRNFIHNLANDLLDNNISTAAFGSAVKAFKLASTQHSQQYSNELKFNGKAWDDRINYVTGFFVMRETNHTVVSQLLDSPPIFSNILFSNTDFQNNTTSLAWYAQADSQIADRLYLTTGVRFTDERKDLNIYSFGSDLLPTFTINDLPKFGIPTHLQTDRWTPKVGLQYRFNDDVNVYVSATNGFKSGGWNARSTDANSFRNFGPEKAWSYEGGIRSEWLDRRLRVNATGYYVKYYDIQIATILPNTATFVTQNSGDEQNYGFELETSGIVADGWVVYANLGLMHGNFTRLSAQALKSGFTSATVPVQTPKYTLQLGTSYTLDTPSLGGSVTASADIRTTDDYWMDNQNVGNGYIKGYYTVNASLRWEQEGGHWAASIDCSNCADRRYWTTILLDVRYPDQPLRVMGHVKFRFD